MDEGHIDLFRDEIIRDHVYAQDVTEVMYRAMKDNMFDNGIYNLGGNHPIAHRRVAEIVVETLMELGVIEKKPTSEYILLIDMPEDLRSKFQFHTFAEGQEPLVSAITVDNDLKMREYVRQLVANKK